MLLLEEKKRKKKLKTAILPWELDAQHFRELARSEIDYGEPRLIDRCHENRMHLQSAQEIHHH